MRPYAVEMAVELLKSFERLVAAVPRIDVKDEQPRRLAGHSYICVWPLPPPLLDRFGIGGRGAGPSLYARQGGDTRVSQNAPRKKIKAWRLGRQTITADNAFALGEALRNLGVPGTSGLDVAFRLGFGSDVAAALVALGRCEHPKSHLAAFTIYSVLPRYFLLSSQLQDGSAWRESLQSLAAERTKTKSLAECESLMRLALSEVGELCASSWKERHRIPGSLGGLLRSLAQQEVEYRRNFASDFDLAEPVTRAWQRLYFDWAITVAYRLHVAPLDGSVEMALLSVALPRVSSSAFSRAWDELSSTPRERFSPSQTTGKGTR